MLQTPDQIDPNRPLVAPRSDAPCTVPAGKAFMPIGPAGTIYFSDGTNVTAVTPPTFPFTGAPPYLRFGNDGKPYWSAT